MHLVVDIGNTNLRWATWAPGQAATGSADEDAEGRPGTLGEIQGIRHHGALPMDLLAAWEALPVPERVLVGNVGGTGLGVRLAQASRSLWGVEPCFAATQAEGFGVHVAYPEPERLGVDRWLSLIAAHRRGLGPALIIDAGTAITYDILLADGRHLGGLILPGVRLLREALQAGTQIPPWADPPNPYPATQAWAADTARAITGASVHAPAALAERLRQRLRERCGTEPNLILTGGDAERIAPLLDLPVRLLPALVLEGLTLLA